MLSVVAYVLFEIARILIVFQGVKQPSSLHTGPFGTKAGTKSVAKNGTSLESGTFEDW